MLEVSNISFSYTPEKPLLQNMSFSLNKGEHLCIMGESGCGKSTLLKVIYGLLDLDKGAIRWGEQAVLGPAFHLIPGMEVFKYVAQDFDLMPYTSVADNIAKFLSRFYPEESRRRTRELLEVIEMTDFADAQVKHLSGGQKQRVAIARALAKEPELLLLDEPFGQIDNFKKRSLRRMLFAYLKEKHITCIEATHDAHDTLSFADKMIVIRNNAIIAHGRPEELYKNPKSNYIASLFDDVNILTTDKKKAYFYPHQIKIVKNSKLEASVVRTYFKGFYWLIEADLKGQRIFLNHHSDIDKNETVFLAFAKGS